MPISNKPEEEADKVAELEETYLRYNTLLSLQQDRANGRILDSEEQVEIVNRRNNVDRALLQLVIKACIEEDQAAKALEICGLFTQRRSLDLAARAAIKYNRQVLADKIGELRDQMESELGDN